MLRVQRQFHIKTQKYCVQIKFVVVILVHILAQVNPIHVRLTLSQSRIITSFYRISKSPFYSKRFRLVGMSNSSFDKYHGRIQQSMEGAVKLCIHIHRPPEGKRNKRLLQGHASTENCEIEILLKSAISSIFRNPYPLSQSF